MAWSQTWSWIDGKWVEGNAPIMGVRTHAAWLASMVFDGARAFEGVTPDLDLHCQRINQSARNLGLAPIKAPEEIYGLAREGLKKFAPDAQLYIRPMYWAEDSGKSAVGFDPDTTQFCLTMYEAPMPGPESGAITLSPFRRPTNECAPTDAKAGCLYPNNARAGQEARSRGFDNAAVRDMLGNVVELTSANVWCVKDGVVYTPAANGTFLAGITRSRTMKLLKEHGYDVVEKAMSWKEFLEADEIFQTGNYGKVQAITRVEDRNLQPGPVGRRARELYWAFAHA